MEPIRYDLQAMLAGGELVPLEVQTESREVEAGQETLLTAVNPTDRDLWPERIRIFDIDLQAPEVQALRNGLYMPSDPVTFYTIRASEKTGLVSNWPRPNLPDDQFFSHSMVIVKPGEDEDLLMAGFTRFDRFEGLFVTHTQDGTVHLSAWVELEGRKVLKAGGTLDLEPLLVTRGRDFHALADGYARHVGRTCQAVLPPETITGWSDWQYYRKTKTEDDVRRSVEAMRPLVAQGWPLKYIVIDDGWCDLGCEWLSPSDKFPSGMKAFGEYLREAGFELGLWFAPYLMNEQSRLVQEHPDWFCLHPDKDEPYLHPKTNLGRAYLLDISLPEVLDWLRHVLEVFVHEWGMKYLKIDGPRINHYWDVRFQRPGDTGTEHINRTFAIIREVCGDEVIVEGEGPLGPAIGMAHLQRHTGDNFPAWYQPETGRPVLKRIAQKDLLGSYLHTRFFHVHRENVLLRDFLSPHNARALRDPARKDVLLTDHELRVQLSAAALSGGSMLLTDPMELLTRCPQRLELATRFLPHPEAAPCRPINIFPAQDAPAFFHRRIERPFETWHVVGAFNWGDLPEDLTLPLDAFPESDRWHVFDHWTETYYGAHQGSVVLKDVPAHGCRMLAVRADAGRPQLLGTNMHLYQGAVDLGSVNWRDDTLEIEVVHFHQQDRKLFVHVPDGWAYQDAESDATDHLVDARRPACLVVHFNAPSGRGARTRLRLRFRRTG